MTRFLFVSRHALIHDLAWEVQKEGHEVKYWIQSKADRDVADGFVPKCDDWEKETDWAEVVVFDDNDFGAAAERWRKAGKPVVGGSTYADRLEDDRDFGQEEMKAAGLPILPKWDFDGFDPAIEFVKKNPERYVVKPNGKAQNEKVLSFVGQEEDGRDIVTMLERYRKAWSTKIKSFQIQKYVAGVEVAIGAFFNGREFILPACVNFEHKRMFNDEIGPSTGEMGTSMFWSNVPAFFNATLAKMRDRLAGSSYTGYFDLNCIVNSRGIHPLEFTSRFGYPTINIQLEGMLSRRGEFLLALAKGEPCALRTKRGFQVGVVVAVPPFPFTDPDAFRKFSEGAAVIFKRELPEGVHLGDVKMVDGEWTLAGNSGYALIVTGSGPTMQDARKEAYNRVKSIIIPNMFYRTDIGERWARDGDLLQTWGLLE
ncbi:MAG: phosphoribosylamine--glycine ligase [Planctomycetes bacterium]|nr:phosphoribosylamine--glycine ligase [Planctomycetota bacterium]